MNIHDTWRMHRGKDYISKDKAERIRLYKIARREGATAISAYTQVKSLIRQFWDTSFIK